ncbi:D-alanyl-D-alanine carboxypeptidase family protein [Candidatus Saccharibacteria bacterium]|nr:D-alanyl-D-alanine carboxypeptidase family protein [Candidatus Saccharibacteria bacterium]
MNDNLKSRRILTLVDVRAVELGYSDEPLVDVQKYDSNVIAEPEQEEMLQYTGQKILVRNDVARRLAKANQILGNSFNLRVVFGYRHPKIQRQYFERERRKIAKSCSNLTEEEIDAATHNLVAVPEVAGHPMGAAVDLTIVSASGKVIDMGTGISEFDKPELIPTFAPNVSAKQMENRLKLHDAMVAAGFAPFYGEWWHFSYGDREWAAFHGRPRAIYGEIMLK